MSKALDVKQVIVVRKDLKMRRGKEIAQGAHAAMLFLINRLKKQAMGELVGQFSAAEEAWMNGHYKKIVVSVDTEQQLLDLHIKAVDAGITSYFVTDLGLTEFKGLQTITALAIGPWTSEQIDVITSGLKLH